MKGRSLRLLRNLFWAAVAPVLLVTGFLWLWVFDADVANTLLAVVAILVFAWLYVVLLEQALSQSRRQFSLQRLILLLTATAALCAAGLAADAFVFLALIAYVFMAARTLATWVSGANAADHFEHGPARVLKVSAWIMASFATLLTLMGTALIIVGVLPVRYCPASLGVLLYPGAIIAWAMFLGDNYRSEAHLLTYALPLALISSLVQGGLSGLLLGYVSSAYHAQRRGTNKLP